jgi:hypothetical protein
VDGVCITAKAVKHIDDFFTTFAIEWLRSDR